MLVLVIAAPILLGTQNVLYRKIGFMCLAAGTYLIIACLRRMDKQYSAAQSNPRRCPKCGEHHYTVTIRTRTRLVIPYGFIKERVAYYRCLRDDCGKRWTSRERDDFGVDIDADD